MKTLSQRIIDFSGHRLKDRFQGALMLSKPIEYYIGHLKTIKPDLLDAMRFTFSHDVGDAVSKMASNTPVDTLLQAYDYAQLPYPKTWIEYTDHNKMSHGYLIEKDGDDIKVKKVLSLPSAHDFPIYIDQSNDFILSRNGCRHSFVNPTLDKIDFNSRREAEQMTIKTILSILLLINSRSNIITLKEDDSHSRTKKIFAKASSKKPLRISNGKIVFNISRILGKNKTITDDRAREKAAATLVRGHFKVRKTGVFFWSPHTRGANDANETDIVKKKKLFEDRKVILPSAKVTLP